MGILMKCSFCETYENNLEKIEVVSKSHAKHLRWLKHLDCNDIKIPF